MTLSASVGKKPWRRSRWGDRFYQVKPGSDAAQALGMMHVLIRGDLVDHAFMEQYALVTRNWLTMLNTMTPKRTRTLLA